MTDNSGVEETINIRNNGGRWVAQGSWWHATTNCGSSSLCKAAAFRRHIVGDQSWGAWPVTHGATNSANCSRNSGNWTGWTGGAGGVASPISPYVFWSTYHDGGPGCGTCDPANPNTPKDGLDLLRMQYYYWGC